MRKLLLLIIPALLVWNGTTAQTALNFDGVDNYIDLGDGFNLSSYTKEAWVKWDGQGLPNNIISGNAVNPHALWAPAFGKLRAGHGSPFEVVEDPNDLVADVWTHIALTYDGATGEMILYRDGEQAWAAFEVPGFVLTDVTIGAFLFEDLTNLFSGQMDDVRIWNKARTADQIRDNYQACLTGTENGLVAFYDFEDGAGSATAADLTGNGYDGTLVGFDIDNDWVTGVNCGDDEEPPVEPIEIVQYYPNPTWNRVNLHLNRDFDRLQVRVYNRYGYFVRGKNVTGPTDYTNAHLYGLRRGYYYILVIDRDTWEYDYVRVYKRGYY